MRIGCLLCVLEKQLLEAISREIQKSKPENIPKEPYIYAHPTPNINATTASLTSSSKPAASSVAKGKSPSQPQAQPSQNQQKLPHPTHGFTPGRRPPIAPLPHPSPSAKWSSYSPAIEAGVLVDTVKAGMNAMAEQQAQANQANPQAAMGGKGKKKVIRVRG